jgi:hypothetical protein
MESTPEQDKIIEEAVQHLPPKVREQVREFVKSLLNPQEHPPDAESRNHDTPLRETQEQYTVARLEQNAQTEPDPLDAILKRIDSIVLELQELRQAVLTQQQPPDRDLVAELYGSWGQGTREELEPDIDWQRFSDE